ncbi:MAG: rRNA pseudouridine synthase [Alistipes sp.]
MKNFKNDSTSTLARFGRDQRTRTSSTTAERVERRPRLQREAGDADSAAQPARRASFNPNFTRDNRPVGETRERRSCGDTPRYGENDKPRYGAGKYTPRGESDQPAEERRYGDKPAYGAKKFGPKKFGEKKFGDKPRFGAPKREFRREEKPKSYPKYDPSKQIGEMRLNRFIAQSGLCSRREADDFISAGLVSVNGVIVTELGSKVMPTDEVKFNDSRVEGEKKVYLVLNKPKGYVTSLEDPHADKLVMDLIKGACTERIYPVGRLDKNSLGLLLFTNDGDLTKQLTHPAYKKKKIYQVTLDKPLTRADMDAIAEGITLEDGEIHADEVSYVKENKKEVGIEIHSGRNRIVRRIFESLGYTVQKLDRVYYAGLTKKNLKRGGWRFLTRDEVNRLKSGQYE